MKFLSLDDMPSNTPEIQFKTSSLNALIGLSTVLILLAGGIFFPEMGSMRYVMIAICLAFSLLPINNFRKINRSTNWLLRARGNSLWIKFRSYENASRPTDEEQIVQIDRSEVEAMRSLKQTKLTSISKYQGSGFSRQVVYFLELVLRKPENDTLSVHLDRERNRGGWMDNPVQVSGDRAIWIPWSSSSLTVRPGLGKALQWFATWTMVLPPATSSDDFVWTTLQKLPSAEQDAKLRTLYITDQKAAIDTVQLLQHCSLQQATNYMQKLTTLTTA